MFLKILHLLWFYIYQWYFHLRLRNNGVVIDPSAIIKGRCSILKGVEIGAQTLIQNSELDGRGGLKIGAHCILDGTVIVTAQHDVDTQEYKTTYSPVIIQDFAILYKGSMILPGRSVGYGAVVAAGAIVTRDVPNLAVVAGNPAKIIRYRKVVHSLCDTRAMGGAVFQKSVNLLLTRISRTILGFHL